MSNVSKSIELLKEVFQSAVDPKTFERLVTLLLCELLDTPFAISSSGSQSGGDAGSSGQTGRVLRIECKKYKDSTSLDERELLGEIDQAIRRDPALEAWVLVTTREASEQITSALMNKGEVTGVPVVIIDWNSEEIPRIVALCTQNPNLLKDHISQQAADLVLELKSASEKSLKGIQRELQTWCLGFNSINEASASRLKTIWSSPVDSNAYIGQNAAGGAVKTIKRIGIDDELSRWWRDANSSNKVGVLVGFEGVGKTWAAIAWLLGNINKLPIVLVIPSSSVPFESHINDHEVHSFLAQCLHDTTGVRDKVFWNHRLRRLLALPQNEGPQICLYLDGINQNETIKWKRFLQVLQGAKYANAVKVIFSTRKSHFESNLGELNFLPLPPQVIEVKNYDLSPGGEFDQRLDLEGISRQELRADLVDLACNPRMFDLVIRLRRRFDNQPNRITVHNLLWEYGRDSLGIRTGNSFTEQEWKAWLKRVAKEYLDGISSYSLLQLKQRTEETALSGNSVAQKLSDIIDGNFIESDEDTFKLKPTVLMHSLGLFLLDSLKNRKTDKRDALEFELQSWMDPVSGFDQKAEILRAAVFIQIERGQVKSNLITSTLLIALLQTQNIRRSHQEEIVNASPALYRELLDVIEHSQSNTYVTAREIAVLGLQSLANAETETVSEIMDRLVSWYKFVSRDVPADVEANPERDKSRVRRFETRVGSDKSGVYTVLGRELIFIENRNESRQIAAIQILQKYKLAPITELFILAAISTTINGRNKFWNGLKWLNILNNRDYAETRIALSKAANQILCVRPEPSVHVDLPNRVSAFLLLLSGHSEDEKKAYAVDKPFEETFTYERDYLLNPAESYFELERRHVHESLNNNKQKLHVRLSRTEPFWCDPAFIPSSSIANEVRMALDALDVKVVCQGKHQTVESIWLEQHSAAFARAVPDTYFDIKKKMLNTLSKSFSKDLDTRALAITREFIAFDENDSSILHQFVDKLLRLPKSNERDHIIIEVAMMLIQHLEPVEQINAIINIGVEIVPLDYEVLLKKPSQDDVDLLVKQYSDEDCCKQDLMISLLSLLEVQLTEYAWNWFVQKAQLVQGVKRGIIFRLLFQSHKEKFGQLLMSIKWVWNQDNHYYENYYGSLSIVAATKHLEIVKVFKHIMPATFSSAVDIRGNVQCETDVLVEIVNDFVLENGGDYLENLSAVVFNREHAVSYPMVFSFDEDKLFESVSESYTLQDMLDIDKRQTRVEKKFCEVTESLQRLQRDTQQFSSAYFRPEQMLLLINRNPLSTMNWIEGACEFSREFRIRINKYKSFYLSLCEAYLNVNSAIGVPLWKAMRSALVPGYIGFGGIDEFMHILFRAPDEDAEIENLRAELFNPQWCKSDKELLVVATCAIVNGKGDWLNRFIEKDLASDIVWRIMRGTVLRGFTIGNACPVDDDWKHSDIRTPHDALIQMSADSRNREALSRYWWNRYVEAETREEAHAAWCIFFNTADIRAFAWISNQFDDSITFAKEKSIHFSLNRSKLLKRMTKSSDKLGKKYLNRDKCEEIYPWLEMELSKSE